MFPIKLKSSESFINLYADCVRRFPFPSSSPILSNPIFGLSTFITYLEQSDPRHANWYKTSGLQSALAPTSIIIELPPVTLGKTEVIHGRITPGMELIL